MRADWQLPPGVSRPLWEQLHDPAAAQRYDERLRDTPLLQLDVDFVFEQCRPPGSLIDLGAGTGRLALAATQLGYRTLAVDLSPEMLKVVGTKAGALGFDVPRLQANLVDLNAIADNSFAYAACLFSTLGLIQGGDNRRRFIAHVFRLLQPAGKFIVHVHNKWFLLGTRHGRRLLVGNRLCGDFIMPPQQGAGPLPMRLFTRREIRRLLCHAGFQLLEVRPVSPTGPLRRRWLFPAWRAYGFLIAAQKPADSSLANIR